MIRLKSQYLDNLVAPSYDIDALLKLAGATAKQVETLCLFIAGDCHTTDAGRILTLEISVDVVGITMVGLARIIRDGTLQ